MEQQVNEAIVQKNTGGKRVKKGSKAPLAAVLVVVVLLAAYAGVCGYARSRTVFFPNCTINGLDVAGLTVPEAQARLEQAFPAQVISLCEESPEHVLTSVTLSDLGVTAETTAHWAGDTMVRQQDTPFLLQGAGYLGALMGKPNGSVYDCGLSEDTVSAAAETVEAALHLDPVHAGYTLEEGVLSVTVPSAGRTLDTAVLAEELRTAANTVSGSRDIFITFVTIPAQTLTARQIHDEIAGELKNAGYDAETGTITPEQMGADFDVSAAQKQMDAAQPGSTIRLDAAIEYPTVTAEELEKVLFRDVLGEYTTKVTGTSARLTNVKLSASSINGYVMNTGDVFSYNEVVGQRTEANGYQAAPAYVQGETVDEIGGGICQTSSTLYLACLLADLEITERYAHRYVPAYIPWGMDATVSWGGPDYKFTNQTDYPIKIVASYSANNSLTVKILGTNVDGSYAKMTNETLSQTDWVTVYEEDPTLAPGTETVKTTPYVGYKVQTFHTIYDKDGNVLDHHYEATSNYKVRNKVIVRGPAVAAQPDTSQPSAEGGTTAEPAVESAESTAESTAQPEDAAADSSVIILPSPEEWTEA